MVQKMDISLSVGSEQYRYKLIFLLNTIIIEITDCTNDVSV